MPAQVQSLLSTNHENTMMKITDAEMQLLL
jgi:hypothetical protein